MVPWVMASVCPPYRDMPFCEMQADHRNNEVAIAIQVYEKNKVWCVLSHKHSMISSESKSFSHWTMSWVSDLPSDVDVQQPRLMEGGPKSRRCKWCRQEGGSQARVQADADWRKLWLEGIAWHRGKNVLPKYNLYCVPLQVVTSLPAWRKTRHAGNT